MNATNPMSQYLRMDRIPHIWCSGCGLGTTVNCFVRAIEGCDIPLDQISVVSGIGCTGRVAGYLKLDSFHTTHGRPIPFATGLKLANPKLKVVVYSGDGDLFAIGGNHFIHAARRNMDLTVICVNNFTYGMTGGQVTPTTPMDAIASTTPYGNIEEPFNLPSSGGIRRRSLCRALDHVPRAANHKSHEGGDSEKRLQLCGNHQSVSDALRQKEQAGRWAGDDAILQGKQHHSKRRRHPGGWPGFQR